MKKSTEVWRPSDVLQECGFTLSVVVILLVARCCSGVPASPTDKLWEEIGSVKTMMAAVSSKPVCVCVCVSDLDSTLRVTLVKEDFKNTSFEKSEVV
jgi:hypothetical protein